MVDYQKMTDTELSALAAQHVMGWHGDGDWWIDCDEHGASQTWRVSEWLIWNPLVYMKIVEMMRCGWSVELHSFGPDGWRCTFIFGPDILPGTATSSSVGRAVTIAALRALDSQTETPAP